MFATLKRQFSLDRFSAIVTWSIVTGICIWLLVTNTNFSNSYIAGAFALCVLYLGVWTYGSQESSEHISPATRIAVTVLLFFIVIAIYFVIPFSFVAIFMVIFSAITPYMMSIKWAFILSPIWSLPLYLVYHFYWDNSGVIITAFLFWTFNLFALVMVNSSIKERDARLAVEESNRHLIATQTLLNEAVKQGERVRIARNIHDLLGHHLTALSINLQVASRTTKDTDTVLKANIDQCHQLAKLLLSDVREAVSDIRDKSKIDLATSIQSMLNKLPSLQLDLQLDDNIQITNIEVADAIIKCVQESITNTLKHAHGKKVTIRIYQNTQSVDNVDTIKSDQAVMLHVDIINDGSMPKELKQGNGLIGMQERIHSIKGSIAFLLKQEQFCTQITIPIAQFD
jgi:two-component system sensor histidine kinase DesK